MRRLLFLGLAMLMSAPVGVRALSLGNLELRSALHQPLDARVPILSATADEIETLNVRVAPAAEFERAGVHYAGILTQLNFEIQQTSRGPDYIRVTSRDPINEPFLNFLIEVNWARGRLIREYTALLDPPLYDPSRRISWTPATTKPAAPVSVAPATASAPRELKITGTPTAPPPPTTPPAVPERAAAMPATTSPTAPVSAPSPSTDGTYPTLWSAATAMRPNSSVSIQQMMIALFRANPEAFIRGNINLLKKGYVLKMPERGAIDAVSRAEALAEVEKHHTLWQEYRQRGAGAAPAQPQGAAVAGSEPDTADGAATTPEARGGDSLKLLASREDAGAGAAGGTSSQGAAEELALAKESLESKERENEELRSQLQESEQIIEKLKSRIALQDSELADLQRKLAEAGGAATGAAPTQLDAAATRPEPAIAGTPTVIAPESWRSLDNEVYVPTGAPPEAVTPAPPAEETSPEAAQVETPVEQPAAAEEAAAPSEGTTAEAAPLEEPAQPEASEAAAPGAEGAPAEEPEAAAPERAEAPTPTGILATVNDIVGKVVPKSILESIPGGALTLLGTLAAVLALIVALVSRRRAAPASESIPTVADTRQEEPAFDLELGAASAETNAAEPAGALATTSDEDLFGEVSKPEEVPVTVPTMDMRPGEATEEDPLAEVNVYLAYERFDEAERLIKEAIANHPNEHKYKLRLLEVYYSSNNKPAYEAAARELYNATGGSGPLWESAVAMWREMSPGRELFSGTAEPEIAVAAPAGRQFVDITAADDKTSRTLTSAMAAAAGTDAVIDIASSTQTETELPGGLDFDLDSGEQEAFKMLDITAPTESGGAEPGILDISLGGVPSDVGPLLEASVPSAIEGASPAVNELLSLTKTGAVQTADSDLAKLMASSLDFAEPEFPPAGEERAAATVGPEDMLDFDLGGEPALAAEAKPGDSNVVDFPSRPETPPAPSPEVAPETLSTMLDIAPSGKEQPMEFDIGGLDLSLDSEVPPPQPAEQSLDLSLDSGGTAEVTVGDIDSMSLDEDTVRLFENDLAATGGQETVPVFEADSGAARTTDELSLIEEVSGRESPAGADELALDTDDVSLDDITKSLEETVGSQQKEGELDTVDLTLDTGTMSEIEETAELFKDDLRGGAEETAAQPQVAFSETQISADDVDTKLNLAKAYIELGDAAGARSILDEVASEGSELQREEAQRLLRELTT